MEKKPIEMDLSEIMELIRDLEMRDFKAVGPFESWNKFFEEHADGYTKDDGIFTQWMGIHEFTLIWKGDDKYPFAYVFPKTENEAGHTFYMKK